jgi:hypothetical protein
VQQDTLDVLGPYEPTLRPGDQKAISRFGGVPVTATAVALQIDRREDLPVTGTLDPGAVVPLRWAAPVPSHWRLEVRERLRSYAPWSRSGKGTFRAELAFTNTGTAPIRRLLVRLEPLDRAGQVIASDSHYDSRTRTVVSGKGLAMGPGERRQQNWQELNLPDHYDHYQVTVTTIE